MSSLGVQRASSPGCGEARPSCFPSCSSAKYVAFVLKVTSFNKSDLYIFFLSCLVELDFFFLNSVPVLAAVQQHDAFQDVPAPKVQRVAGQFPPRKTSFSSHQLEKNPKYSHTSNFSTFVACRMRWPHWTCRRCSAQTTSQLIFFSDGWTVHLAFFLSETFPFLVCFCFMLV